MVGFSYYYARPIMVDAEPYQIVTRSNMTVMLLVFFGLAGFLNSRGWARIEEKHPRFKKKNLLGWRLGTWCSAGTLIIVVLALIGLHTAVGYQLKW